MDEADLKKLNAMLSKINIARDHIIATCKHAFELSNKGFAKDVVEVWTNHEAAAKGNDKIFYYFIAHEVLVNHNADGMKLLKAFPNAFNKGFYKSLWDIKEQSAREEIVKCIHEWKKTNLYSETYTNYLFGRIEKANKEVPPIVKPIEVGISNKVKIFAIYFRNYKECKVRLENLYGF
jgi:hypothetical protein